jgi:hypothetical protein
MKIESQCVALPDGESRAELRGLSLDPRRVFFVWEQGLEGFHIALKVSQDVTLIVGSKVLQSKPAYITGLKFILILLFLNTV